MHIASQPLVSVVSPVYNEAPYLAECIESVLGQSYQNWELTIVDNLSTDGSAEIAAQYAEKDHRIRVKKNQQFLRAIPNHNAALRQISPESKYCKVLFGDDWMFPECLERMVGVAEEHPTVGIVGAYTLEGQRVMLTGLPYHSKVIYGREICRGHLLDKLYVFGSATSLLYRADLVRSRERFYNEANLHADTEVCFALLNICDFGFVHQVLTFSRVRPKSLTTLSTDIQTNLAGMLQILNSYGPTYLNRQEFDECMERHLSAYYRFLGKSLFLGRDETFWDWHKRGMIAAGVRFSRKHLAIGMLAEMCDAILNPKHTIQRILTTRSKSAGATSERNSEALDLDTVKETRA